MSRSKSLEVFKFAVYVAVPIALTAFVVYNPTNLQKVIENKSYIKYPPEGPRPPSLEEIQELIKKKQK